MGALHTAAKLRAALAVLACILVCAAACAEVKLEAELEREAFHAPADTVLHVRVVNSEGEKIGALRLNVAGKLLDDLPEEIAAGSSYECETAVRISQNALNQGYISVTLTYRLGSLDEIEQKLCYVRRLEDKVEARLICALPDRGLEPDEPVPVSYILYNTGETDIRGAVVTMLPGGRKSTETDIPAGGYARFSQTVEYSRLDEVSARAECASAVSGTPYVFEAVLDDVKQFREEINLRTVSDESVTAGSGARVSLSMENAGDYSYSTLTLRDAVCGYIGGLPAALLPGDYIGVNYTTPPLYEDTSFSPTLTLLRDDGVSVRFELMPFEVKVATAAAETDSNPETPAARQAPASAREGLFQRAMYAVIRARGLHLWLTGLCAGAAVFILITLLRAPRKAGSGTGKGKAQAKEAKDAADKTNV